MMYCSKVGVCVSSVGGGAHRCASSTASLRKGARQSVVVAHASGRNSNNQSKNVSTRREVLLEIGGGAASSLLLLGSPATVMAAEDGVELLPVEKLPNIAKKGQIADVYKLIKTGVRAHVTDDYTNLLQLAFLDAATYDKESKTGGANGSIRNGDELKALGLTNLTKTLDQIGKAKAEAEKAASFPLTISWADMIAMSAYYTTLKHFQETLLSRAADPAGGAIILQAYANDIQIPQLGRVDAAGGSDSISDKLKSLKTTDLVERCFDTGLIAGQIAALAVCFPTGASSLEEVEEEIKQIDGKLAGYVDTYQKSRKELTQTSYQISVGRALAKLTTLGANFEQSQYYHPIPKPTFKA